MVTITRTSNSTEMGDLTAVGSTITYSTASLIWLEAINGTGQDPVHVIEDITVKTEPSKKTKPKKVNKTNSGLRKPTDMERRRIIDV